jgi:hypothetical protein
MEDILRVPMEAAEGSGSVSEVHAATISVRGIFRKSAMMFKEDFLLG